MKKDEFLDYHKDCCDRLVEITKKKNSDYSGNNENPFFNYEAIEKLDVASVEQGFLTRILDKYNRVNSFVKQGFLTVEDEKVEDTLLDMANYAIMMSAYFKHKKQLNK